MHEQELETIENEHLNTWEKFYSVEQPADNINHPSHYQGKIECIDYLQDKLTAEEFKGFLKGNVLKYLSRAGKKENELEDYKKSKWYLEKLITTMEKK